MGTLLAIIDRTYDHLIRDSEAATIDRMNARATASGGQRIGL